MTNPVTVASNRTLILDFGAGRTALGAFRRQGPRLVFDHYAAEILPVHAGSEDHWLEHTRAALTVLRGKVVVDGGQYLGDLKDGKFLPRKISEEIHGGAML